MSNNADQTIKNKTYDEFFKGLFGQSFLVKKPDNKLRQEVWHKTYCESLAKNQGITMALMAAQRSVNIFDSLFTEISPL